MKEQQLSQITGKEILINDSIQGIDSIKKFIAPYRNHIKEVLDEPLAYNPKALKKTDGELNSSIGNLMADITYEISNPIFEKRTGKQIDFALLNYGGIRAVMSEGIVTRRTAFEIMPFENKVLIVELTGAKVKELVKYLKEARTAHPVSKQFQLVLNSDGTINDASINQKPINNNETYFVATSDFLANGGDHMNFFKNPVSTTDIDYLLRNEIIDHLVKVDTIKASVDNRFIQKK